MSESEYVISVEELCARKTVKRVLGRSEQENQGPVEGISETQKNVTLVIKNENVQSKIDHLKKLSNAADEESSTSQNSKPKIQRVPMVLQGHKNFNKYFEPRLVSIGPIHHGKQKLKLAEDFKTKLVGKFIKDSGKTTEIWFGIVQENIQELKKLFDKEVIQGYDDETLSLILFLDGCFILKFISSCVDNNKLIEKFKIKIDQLVFAHQDLFLLENQIPFEVLTLLMYPFTENKRNKLKASIRKFIIMNIMAPEGRK